MKHYRRFFALMLVGTLLLACGACGGGPSGNALLTNTTAPDTDTPTTENLATLPPDPTQAATPETTQVTTAGATRATTVTAAQASTTKTADKPATSATTKAAQTPAAPRHPDLPQLTVRQLHRIMSRVLPPIQAIRLTTNWRWENGMAVASDSQHPLQMRPDAFDGVTVKDHVIYLEFDYPPQSIEVRRWPATFLQLAQDEKPFEQYETVYIGKENSFEQLDGDFIYEVIARWPNSTIHYAFRAITVPAQ